MYNKQRYFRKFYTIEHIHQALYRKLASIEKNPGLKRMLEMLSDAERYDANCWCSLINKNQIPKVSTSLIEIEFLFFSLIKRIFGAPITVKMIEAREARIRRRMIRSFGELKLNEKEKLIIKRIETNEKSAEHTVQQKMMTFSKILDNIKDITLGMNDGLVEILAATVGLGAALNTPTLVFIAGFIVAISGTLSMAGGAYISTEYQGSIKGVKDQNATAKASAAYMGVAYIIGAIFPLLPFALGVKGYLAIALSIVITTIVLTAVSIFISIISNTKISKRLATTLLISLGAAAITILIGAAARGILHIVV